MADRTQQGDQTWFKPRLLGVSLHLAWIYSLFYDAPNDAMTLFGRTISESSATFWGSGITLALALIPFVVRPSAALRIARASVSRTLTPAMVCLGTACVYLFSVPAGGTLQNLAYVAGLLLTGVGSALLVCRWVDVFRRERTGIVLMHATPTISAVVALCVTMTYFPESAQALVTCLLPLGATIALERCDVRVLSAARQCDAAIAGPPVAADASHQAQGRRATSLASLSMPLLYACLFELGALPSFLETGASEAGSLLAALFCTISAFATLAISVLYIVLFHRRETLLSVAFPLALFVCVFIPSTISSGSAFAYTFLAVGYICLEALLFVLMTIAGKQAFVPAVRVYAVGRIVYMASDVLGRFAGTQLQGLPPDTLGLIDAIVTGLGVCAVFAFAGLLLLMASNGFFVRTLAAEPETALSERSAGADEMAGVEVLAEPASTPNLAVDDLSAVAFEQPSSSASTKAETPTSLELFATQHGLTARETDVLAGLLRGHTSQRIQEALSISRGTANYHIQNIYSKCGVHSKQELMDLYETDSMAR